MMIELCYLRVHEKVKSLPKELQETIQGILQILDTEYGADRNKNEDDGGYVLVVEEEKDFEKIKDKKDTESIELHFDNKVQKYFLNNK